MGFDPSPYNRSNLGKRSRVYTWSVKPNEWQKIKGKFVSHFVSGGCIVSTLNMGHSLLTRNPPQKWVLLLINLLHRHCATPIIFHCVWHIPKGVGQKETLKLQYTTQKLVLQTWLPWNNKLNSQHVGGFQKLHTRISWASSTLMLG